MTIHVSTLCLGALSLGEASGYELKKFFEETFAHFHSASFGSIYPALSHLERDGLVTHRVEEQTHRPARKIYTLTANGRQRLAQTLDEVETGEQLRSDFLVQMFFAHLLPAGRVAAAVSGRLAATEAQIAYLEQVEARADLLPGMRFTVRYGLAVNRAKRDFLRSAEAHVPDTAGGCTDE